MAAPALDRPPGTLYTIGHGTLEPGRLTEILRSAGVAAVVDVRTAPGSRRHPAFARAALEEWLPAAGVAYRWEPRLGGFRRPAPDSPNTALRHEGFRGYADHMRTPEFAAAVEQLLVSAAARRTTVMCAESLWWRCHRRLLADAVELLERWPVRHLLHPGGSDAHRPTDGVRVEGDHLVYDAGRPTLGST